MRGKLGACPVIDEVAPQLDALAISNAGPGMHPGITRQQQQGRGGKYAADPAHPFRRQPVGLPDPQGLPEKGGAHGMGAQGLQAKTATGALSER